MAEKLPKVVEDAKAAGKTILALEGIDKTYYFEKPGKKDMERFIATATKGKVTQAVNNLIFDRAIHPSKEELAAEFESMPGRMVALNDELQAAIGMKEDFTVKKL